MRCPVCKIDMIVVEYKKIELDYCVRCSGVWFDSGEMELFRETAPGKGAGSLQISPLAPPKGKPAEKRRRCPLCRHKMDKVTIGDKPAAVIDSCPQGEGLWFDGGELAQVITELAAQPSGGLDSGNIVAFLGDVFQSRKKPEPKKHSK